MASMPLDGVHAIDERLREHAVLRWLQGQAGVPFMYDSERANMSHGKAWREWERSLVNGRDWCSPLEALERCESFRSGRAPLFYGGTLVWCVPTEAGYSLLQEPNHDFLNVCLGKFAEGDEIGIDRLRTTPVGAAAAAAGYPAESTMQYHGERELRLRTPKGMIALRVFARTPQSSKPWCETVEHQIMLLLTMPLGEYVLRDVWVSGRPVELRVSPAQVERVSGEVLTIVPAVEWLGIVDLDAFLDAFRRGCTAAWGGRFVVWAVNPPDRRSKHHFHAHGARADAAVSPLFGVDAVAGLMGKNAMGYGAMGYDAPEPGGASRAPVSRMGAFAALWLCSQALELIRGNMAGRGPWEAFQMALAIAMSVRPGRALVVFAYGSRCLGVAFQLPWIWGAHSLMFLFDAAVAAYLALAPDDDHLVRINCHLSRGLSLSLPALQRTRHPLSRSCAASVRSSFSTK